MVTNMYPSARKPWSGIFVKEQIDDLRGLGLDVEVLAFDGTEQWQNYIRAMANLHKIINRDQFELVHAHYGLTGIVALSQRSVPVVTTFHGSDYNGYVPWQAPVSWVAARCATPIFVSREANRRLKLPGAPVIPAAVDTDLFVPQDRASTRRKLGWTEDGPYVLFPGPRAVKVKNVGLFDAAVAIARESAPKLRTVSLESFSRKEVALVMNAVDVTVMTSLAEGSPVSVKESLACATPVVSVQVADIAETLRALPGCRVVPPEPRQLAEALVSALAAERDEKLRNRALLFSRHRTASRVAAVYEDVLAKTSFTY